MKEYEQLLFPGIEPVQVSNTDEKDYEMATDPLMAETDVMLGWILIEAETGIAMSTVVDEEEKDEVFQTIAKDNGSATALVECMVIAPKQ